MQLPPLRKMLPIVLAIAALILLVVVVFEGWTMASVVGQNLFLIVIGGVFIAVLLYILWHFLIRVEERPTIAWKKKLESSARVSIPKQLYGHKLWGIGDQKHSPHPLGTMIGWTSLMHEYRVPYMDSKDKNKPLLDSNKMPLFKPLRYDKDEFEAQTQPDGTIASVLMHKKGEIKTWNESLFVVAGKGFFAPPLIYRVPEKMHSDLSGDVMCNCISFIQKGEYMYPNTIYEQPEVELMMRNEIRLESFYGLLDDIKLGVKKGMDSNPQHRMGMEQKKLIEVPTEG